MRAFVVATALLLSACAAGASSPQTPTVSEQGLPDRDPALAKRLVEEEGGVLLDVRSPEEFEAGHLEGAVNVPHDQLQERAAEIETLTGGARATPIVTYCGSGRRAGQARATLEAAGYTQVTNVGGMKDYPQE